MTFNQILREVAREVGMKAAARIARLPKRDAFLEAAEMLSLARGGTAAAILIEPAERVRLHKFRRKLA